MPAMNDILGIILGGGRGQRLYPLTRERAKPAVPFAGKYRLIDIPISNCINSSINRIAVLTQYNSVSLHRHISRTFTFDVFHPGWVQILAAEQTPHSEDWYQGTADAVRKHLIDIRSSGAKYVLILAGDHLYRMDYREMAEFHWDHQADVTVAVQPVLKDQTFRFGILKRNADDRITDFAEKPTDPDVLKNFVSRDDEERPYIGSMGIYLFKTKILIDLLASTTDDDFGYDVIPNAIHSNEVYGFNFDDYWEDIGTVRSFYETNLSLTSPDPQFNFHDPVRPIYTHARFLPSSVIHGAKLENVMLSEGCRVGNGEIMNSIIGLRSHVGNNVKINNTIMMGADYYDPYDLPPQGGIPMGIGEGCEIDGAIIDKNVRIGPDVIIKPFPRGTEIDCEQYVVRDGIVVIPKHTILQPGTTITPEQHPECETN